MALFGSARDASLIRSVNKEVINRYIDIEVAFYKLDLQSTNSNIYNESDNKVYYGKMKMPCLVLKDTKSQQADDYGLDYTRTGTFAFLRDELKEKNIIVEPGDVLEYDGEYFEIDSVSASQYFAGKNPETWPNGTSFGYSVSVLCDAHVTRQTPANIRKMRFGKNNDNRAFKGFK